jgi:hypothetical protein
LDYTGTAAPGQTYSCTVTWTQDIQLGLNVQLLDRDRNEILSQETVFLEAGSHSRTLTTIVPDWTAGAYWNLRVAVAPCCDPVPGDEYDWTVNVGSQTQPPTAYIDFISPNSAELGQTVAFSGHGSDPDGYIVEYNWRSSLDGQLSGSQSFSTSSLSVGTHTIYFDVKDNDGLWSEEATATLEIGPPKPNIIITNLKISGSGDVRPAFITASFTVKNLAGSIVNVGVKTQKDCNPLTGDCTVLDDQQITLAAYESRDFSKSFTEIVTGQHTLVVSVFGLSGTLITGASQDYVVGPITPGHEPVVIFIPDPFDPTTGKLQIQNPDGSIKEIRIKKVPVDVTHTGQQSYQPSSTLKVYSYVPVPPALCIAKVVSPIPLSLDDMIQTGFVTLSEDVIKEITGVAVPVSKIVTALQIVQCLYGTEDKVEIVGNWQFGQPQTYYFALDRNAKLEAEYQYVPLGTTSPVTETGQWQGTIDQSLDSIIVRVGETTSSQPSQPFSIGDLSLSADPTSIATSDSTTITVNYSIQTYLPVDLTITLEVWEDTHMFGIFDKKLCSQSPSADANQASCSIRGLDLGLVWQTGNHDLFARLTVNWHSLDNNEPTQTKKESQRITISVNGSWWPLSSDVGIRPEPAHCTLFASPLQLLDQDVSKSVELPRNRCSTLSP